jgi:hypothetical protein
MKGGIFRSHLAWAREHRNEKQVEELFAAIRPEISKSLSGPLLATVWLPFEWLVELDRTMLNLWGSEFPNLLADLGRYSAEINLSTTYKLFHRDSNHEFFLKSALLHSQFQDFGKVEYLQLGPTSGQMIHREYPCYSRIFCESAIGYFEGTIMSHGGVAPKITESVCQCMGEPSCTFDMSWT